MRWCNVPEISGITTYFFFDREIKPQELKNFNLLPEITKIFSKYFKIQAELLIHRTYSELVLKLNSANSSQYLGTIYTNVSEEQYKFTMILLENLLRLFDFTYAHSRLNLTTLSYFKVSNHKRLYVSFCYKEKRITMKIYFSDTVSQKSFKNSYDEGDVRIFDDFLACLFVFKIFLEEQ